MTWVFSPDERAPFAANPLEPVLAKSIDFERLATGPIMLSMTANNVRTGRGPVSGIAHPMPLALECTSPDTIVVPINPVERPGTRTTARDLLNLPNEGSSNSVQLKELRMIAMLRQVADPGSSEGARCAIMRVHAVDNDLRAGRGYSSKPNAETAFRDMPRDEGRQAAAQLLATHGDALGRRSSLPIERLAEGA